MATVTCRVQYLEDSDPFVCSNFPEPRRPPQYDLSEHLPLNVQMTGIHKLLEAPLKLEECALQLAPNGNYLDLESSLTEQRDDLEQFYDDVAKGKKPILILRTQLTVRVHSILGPVETHFGPLLSSLVSCYAYSSYDGKHLDLVCETQSYCTYLRTGRTSPSLRVLGCCSILIYKEHEISKPSTCVCVVVNVLRNSDLLVCFLFLCKRSSGLTFSPSSHVVLTA